MLRVATFNVRYCEVAGIDAVIDILRGIDAEVLALQELDRGAPRTWFRDQPGRIARALGSHVVFARASRVGLVGQHGVALLAKTAWADVEPLALPRATRRATPRAGLVADAGAIRVATGHLSIERDEARRQLGALVRALTSRRPPWLLLGDLNLRPPDVAAVIEPFGLSLPASSPLTYPAAAPAFAIDHAAAGGGAEVVVVAAGAVIASDHRPLTASISVR